MVLSLVKKINVSELSNHIKGMNECYASSQGFILQPKFGAVTFGFDKHIGNVCSITFRRDAGNGLVMISSNGVSENYQIGTKQTIDVNIDGDGSIVLNRTLRSKGDLAILDISLYCQTKTKEEFNDVLSRCSEHSCIRFLEDKLVASSGSFITGKDIVVKTEPEGSFIRNGYRVTFISSCTILDLEIDGVSNKSNSLLLPIINNKKENPGTILYKSDDYGFNQKYCLNEGMVTEFGVQLNYRDSYVLPLECLSQNVKSTIVVEVSSTSGNGMFGFGLVPGSDVVWHVASKEQREFILEVTPSTSDNYCISILRHPSAKGTIIISNILVILDSYNAMIETREIIPFIEQRENKESPKTNIEQEKTGNDIVDSVIYYSRSIENNYKTSSSSNSISTIGIGSFNGREWYDNVRCAIPNVMISANNPNSSISCFGNLIPAKKMYIENFQVKDIIDSEIEKLSSAQCVYVTSQTNQQMLLDKIKSPIKITSKKLPFAEQCSINYISGFSFVLLNNNKNILEILESIKDTGIKVVLLNARGKYPSFVIPVNEYIQYNELVYLFDKAKCFIEFTKTDDEVSSYIDLALSYGTQVITQSWAYMDNRNVLLTSNLSLLPGFISSASKKARQDDGFLEFTNDFLS